jgi:hypothetical protein
MAEQQKEPKPEEQDEKLQVEKEKLGDLRVPEEEAENVKGGLSTACIQH